MNAAAPFRSPVGPVMTRFLALKRALGRGSAREEAILRALDAVLAAHVPSPADLTAATFAAWGQTLLRLTPGVRRNWLRIARNLCLYRRRTEPACFVPDPAGFPTPHQPVAPSIFAPQEIARLLQCADRLRPTPGSPLRAAAYRLAVVLLYTTGLRRGELVRLMVGDYEPGAQTLAIRASKFHKSRCVPLAADGAREIERYLAARRADPDRSRRRIPSCGAAQAACGRTLGRGLPRDSGPSAERQGSRRRPAGCPASMTCATAAPCRRCCGGTAPGQTCRPSSRSSRPTWGMSRSSRRPTTCTSSRPSPWPRATGSPNAMAR